MSDLSVFHRVDDVAALTITRFLTLVVRLSAYAGALRARYTQESAGMASPADVPAAGVPSAGGGDTPPEVVKRMKMAQFAARHSKMRGSDAPPVDPSAIEWNDDKILRELVNL